MSPVFYAIAQYYYSKRYEHYFLEGMFPPVKYSRANLLEAYVCLAARMIQIYPKEAREKNAYLNQYFKTHFPKQKVNYFDSLVYSYRHPVSIVSITRWMSKHLVNQAEKEKVIRFLVGLAVTDGAMTSNEMRLVNTVLKDLDVNQYTYVEILKEFHVIDEKKKTQVSQLEYHLLKAVKTLGINLSDDMDEIKKVYRILVKKYHPDRLINASQQEVLQAEERFLEIQSAFEIIEAYKKSA